MRLNINTARHDYYVSLHLIKHKFVLPTEINTRLMVNKFAIMVYKETSALHWTFTKNTKHRRCGSCLEAKEGPV